MLANKQTQKTITATGGKAPRQASATKADGKKRKNMDSDLSDASTLMTPIDQASNQTGKKAKEDSSSKAAPSATRVKLSKIDSDITKISERISNNEKYIKSVYDLGPEIPTYMDTKSAYYDALDALNESNAMTKYLDTKDDNDNTTLWDDLKSRMTFITQCKEQIAELKGKRDVLQVVYENEKRIAQKKQEEQRKKEEDRKKKEIADMEKQKNVVAELRAKLDVAEKKLAEKGVSVKIEPGVSPDASSMDGGFVSDGSDKNESDADEPIMMPSPALSEDARVTQAKAPYSCKKCSKFMGFNVLASECKQAKTNYLDLLKSGKSVHEILAECDDEQKKRIECALNCTRGKKQDRKESKTDK